LLLLENPFDGLEPNAIVSVREMMAKLENVTMLVTAGSNAHEEIFDKIIYLENGSILSVESKNK
jgi:ABC-type multidrug transport system ATPase subunit